MKLSISALSVAYGLTPEAIRFYEEKGLLSPERSGSSGYRRYLLNDVQRIGFIKSYQRQGFSLDEIKHILTDCPKDELISMMDEKRALLREQLTQTHAIYDRMTTCTDLLRDRKNLELVPRLCPGAAAYTIDFASTADMFASISKNSLLQNMIDALPLTSYCSILPLKLLEGGEAPIRIGICAPVEYSAAIHADFSQMSMCAGPRTVRCLFELFDAKTCSLDQVLALCLDFIRKHNLTPVCDGYTRQYVWFADETGCRQHYAELIIPVRG